MSVTSPGSNPYRPFIEGHAALLQQGAALPLGGLTPSLRSPATNDGGKVLIFSPHPDDECIIGGLPLRLMRELRMQVTNVAVTLGRHPERQAARWRELQGACAYIGFSLLRTVENGLADIDPATREQQADSWAAAVAVIAEILIAESPDIVFIPHDGDWHPAHIGTHHLVLDALRALPSGFACHVIENEFWGAMATPNLMVESGSDDVADLVAALSFHVGEVTRNPFHLRLPAWMIDNVRRGSELVQGKGETAPDMTFATLYRLRHWTGGALSDALPKGRVLTAADDLHPLLGVRL
ncbi:MAG: PIG-L family deacetylase [Alphaproteobacteria bacterium]|nr:PIG-L family deacetylase [Alphaproteobacteria bacterium]